MRAPCSQRKFQRTLFLAPVFIFLCATGTIGVPSRAAEPAPAGSKNPWRGPFQVNKAALASTGTNPYFILEPGYRLHFAHGNATLVVSVLDETKVVDGVETRVVEEREEKGGQIREISRNYFAIDRATKDVYYFGEDSTEYENGKPASQEGSWLSGVKGATFGLMMPGTIHAGDRFYQEMAPKIAMDRAEIAGLSGEVTTPAGVFKNCLEVRETSPLEKGTSEKRYARDVGLIKDDEMVLTKVDAPRVTDGSKATVPVVPPKQ